MSDAIAEVCKFWLEPVALSTNDGFTANEVNRIRRLVLDHPAHHGGLA